MRKKYILFTFLLFSISAFSQEDVDSKKLEILEIYPNPVTTGRLFVNSKNSLPKDIEIFDVLGKKVLQVTIATKELNVASLTPGIYIIKIKEGELSAARKLIIK
jgi:hypothetical protein